MEKYLCLKVRHRLVEPGCFSPFLHISTFEVPIMKGNRLSKLTSIKGSKQEIDMVPLTSEEQYAINHTKIIKTSHRFGDHMPCSCIKRFQSTESAMKKPGKHFRHEGWSIYPCDKSKKSFHYG